MRFLEMLLARTRRGRSRIWAACGWVTFPECSCKGRRALVRLAEICEKFIELFEWQRRKTLQSAERELGHAKMGSANLFLRPRYFLLSYRAQV
jgi:hypothetical protein